MNSGHCLPSIFEDFIEFRMFGTLYSTVQALNDSVHRYLRHCNTIYCTIMWTFVTVYLCIVAEVHPNVYRYTWFVNNVYDCDNGDDEICLLINEHCSPIEYHVLFKYSLNNLCFSSRRFNNAFCDCEHSYYLQTPLMVR